jgi:hypothetical protein
MTGVSTDQEPPVKRPRLLAAAASQKTVSVTRVASGILHAIAPGFEVHQLAIGYDGDPHEYPWKLYPSARKDDPYGVTRICDLIERLKPDLIFFMLESKLVTQLMKRLHEAENLPPSLAYAPIDAGPVSTSAAAELAQLDRLVLCTRFSRDLVIDAFDRLKDGPPRRPAIQIIPHALDRDLFYPLDAAGGRAPSPVPDRRALRQQHWPDQPALWDDFIVLNANRNQPRKRIDITMQGFAEFARGKPGVKLCLHMGLRDMGWDILCLAEHYGIKDQLIL